MIYNAFRYFNLVCDIAPICLFHNENNRNSEVIKTIVFDTVSNENLFKRQNAYDIV